MWLEICTDDEEDWKRALTIFARGFLKAPWLTRFGADRSTLIAFAEKYFEYVYETQMSDDRAALACVKTRKSDGSVAIVYAYVLAWNRQRPTTGNISGMQRVSEIMAQDDGVDEWHEKMVHGKVREAAKSHNFCYLYSALDAIAPEFSGKGIGTKYFTAAQDMIYCDAIRRGKLEKHKPCLIYGIIDDPRIARYDKGKSREIAHLHGDENSGCLRSENPDSKDQLKDCILVTAYIKNGSSRADDEKLLRQISEIFENNLTLH